MNLSRTRFGTALALRFHDPFASERKGGGGRNFRERDLLGVREEFYCQFSCRMMLGIGNSNGEDAMAFCAVCGSYHDPDLLCFNKATQTLRGAGIEEEHQKPGAEFRKIAKLADRFMLKVLIAALADLVALVILARFFGTIR